jgi:hypothetical protein
VGGRLWADRRGAILPLALLLTLAFVWFALPLLTWIGLDGTRVLVQRAADAAALAGAGQAILTRQTDARGQVYCQTLAVDPVAGPVAAARYWQADTAALPSLVTAAFAATASGNRLTVAATVQVPSGGFVFWGFSTLSWTVQATAEAVYPSGVPTC